MTSLNQPFLFWLAALYCKTAWENLFSEVRNNPWQPDADNEHQHFFSRGTYTEDNQKAQFVYGENKKKK